MDEDLLARLRHIEANDPDGDESRRSAPTEADYAAHKAWAVGRYGQVTWDQYRKGGWEPQPEW